MQTRGRRPAVHSCIPHTRRAEAAATHRAKRKRDLGAVVWRGSPRVPTVSEEPEAHRVGARLAGELIRHIEQAYPDDAARRDALLGSFERLDVVTRLHRGLSPWPGDARPADWPPSSQ